MKTLDHDHGIYDAGDVGRVMTTLPGVSARRVCRVLRFSRARLRARAAVCWACSTAHEVKVLYQPDGGEGK